jgi:hypothetical protein
MPPFPLLHNQSPTQWFQDDLGRRVERGGLPCVRTTFQKYSGDECG